MDLKSYIDFITTKSPAELVGCQTFTETKNVELN